MKRLIALLVSTLLFVNSIFAFNFFTDRFFEVKVDVPMGFSNNVFAVGDFLQKDLVIDLPKIADSIPKTGLATIIRTNPEVGIKLNIAGFSLGVNAGADVFTKLTINKGLFDFLLKGYKVGETITVALEKPVLDTFVYAGVPIGLKFKKFKINVTPSVFYPVAILDDCNVKATATNDADGNVSANVDVDANVYTTTMAGSILGEMYTGPQGDINTVLHNIGVDLGSQFSMPLTKRLGFSVDARIPIVPAKLDASMNIKANYAVEGNIMDMATGKEAFKETKPFEYTMTASKLETPYKINRPLKINAYADYSLFGFLKFKAGGGFAVRRTATDSPLAYPEYYISAGVSLFEMLKATLSTEYTDLLFRHQFEAVVNLRFVELDLGVSLEASNFLRSFEIAGLGAHVGVVIGF